MIKKMECIPYTDLFRFARRVKRNFPFGMLTLSVKVFYVVAYLYTLYNALYVYLHYLTNEFNIINLSYLVSILNQFVIVQIDEQYQILDVNMVD